MAELFKLFPFSLILNKCGLSYSSQSHEVGKPTLYPTKMRIGFSQICLRFGKGFT